MFAKFRFFRPARLVFDEMIGSAPGVASETPSAVLPVVPSAPAAPLASAPVIQAALSVAQGAAPAAPSAAPAPQSAAPPGAAPAAPSAAPTPAPAPAALNSPALEARKVEIAESLKVLVTDDLSKLKGILGDDFIQLGEALKLKAKAVSVDVPANLDFMAKENVARLAATLSSNWKVEDLTPAVTALKARAPEVANTSESEVRELLSTMYAAAILTKAGSAFGIKHPLFDNVSNPQAVANFGEFNKSNLPGFQFSVNVEFDPQSHVISKAGVVVPARAEAAYKKFETDKGSTAVGKTPEALEAEQNRKDRINAFKNTFLARVLGFFGLLPMKDGPDGKKEVDYGAILDGSDPIAVFAIGICGGKELLDDPKGFDEMVKSIPDKQRSMVDGLVKNAEGSALSLKKAVEGLKERGAVAGAPTPEPFDNGKFNDWMAGKDAKGNKVEMPQNGFALSRDYSFDKAKKAESLHVDLRGGGEIVIPEIGTLNTKIGGKEENLSALKGQGPKTIKASDFSDLTIVGTIPKKTIFKGNLKIQAKYKEEKAAS